MNALRDFAEFIADCWPPLAIGFLLVAFFVALMIGAIQADTKARNEFMEACVQDHKEYECVAMWRAGEPDYVPVVVPVR